LKSALPDKKDPLHNVYQAAIWSKIYDIKGAKNLGLTRLMLKIGKMHEYGAKIVGTGVLLPLKILQCDLQIFDNRHQLKRIQDAI
jgi:hypothetical protein